MTDIDTTKPTNGLVVDEDSCVDDDEWIDVRHKHPRDMHSVNVWFIEEPTASGVLTQDGLTQIAFHQYVPGTYTTIDTILNPVWAQLTELLPLHIAPNTVTTIGGFHCLVAYIVTWMYGTVNYDENDNIPNWMFLLNAYCLFAYYTFDCMDGKQARRTNSSSPLGQLFDHGIDCICLHQHVNMVMLFLLPSPSSPALYFYAQASLQISFFVAQWEEYYTGSLPHSTGNIGVTEISYGFVVWSLSNVFFDYKRFYGMSLSAILPSPVNVLSDEKFSKYQVKHILLYYYFVVTVVLISLSIIRVIRHIGHHRHKQVTFLIQLSAITKLISPIVIGLIIPTYLIPSHILIRETRYISLCIGMCMASITIKIIVFGMAKEAYASIQYKDCWILIAAALWVKYDSDNFTPAGIHLLFQLIAIGYILRILYWTNIACTQICERLNIHMFTIKNPDHKSKLE